MLYPSEEDESYLRDDDINVSNRIRDIYLEKGDIPFSERKVNRYLKERKEEERVSRMQDMMVPEFPERIDAKLSLPTPELSEGMRVSWDYRGERRYGTIVEVKGKGAMIRTDEGKEFIKMLEELKSEVDDQGSYWGPDGGGKKKRTKKKKKGKMKTKKTRKKKKTKQRGNR